MIYHLHIPRCGGTTLRRLIREYAPSAMFTVSHHLNRKAEDAEFVEDTLIVSGHYVYGYHEITRIPGRYVTILRDPIERYVSWYYFLKDHPAHGHYVGDASLMEWALGDGTIQYDNLMTRMLAGDQSFSENCIVDWSVRKERVECDQAMIDLALHNVRSNFVHVGFMKQYVNAVNTILGLIGSETFFRHIRKSNVSDHPKPKDLDRETLAKIKERNRFDTILYKTLWAEFAQ